MLRVQREQFAAFEALSRRRFEAALFDHLRAELPEESAALGDDGVRGIVTFAIDRGKAHGFVTEQHVCLFATAALLLGPDLETSPKLRWAKRILEDPNRPFPGEKLDGLFEAIAEHLGEDDDDDDDEEGE